MRQEGAQRLEMVRWGLIPSWANDPSIGNRMVNARAETVAEKPAFRTAFRKRRCLVPVGGFFEWRRTGDGKVPYWIHPAGGGVATLAGLWERWHPADAEPVRTFTLLTVAANVFMTPRHDRMPVVVPPDARDAWLDPGAGEGAVSALLRPCPEDFLAAHPVFTRVNSPSSDNAALLVAEALPA